MILKMENGDGEDDKVKTTLSKQRVPTHLKSDDKDDKDLPTHRPEQGVPKSGEGFIDFIGQVGQTPKGNFFINLIMVIGTIVTAFNKSKLVINKIILMPIGKIDL